MTWLIWTVVALLSLRQVRRPDGLALLRLWLDSSEEAEELTQRIIATASPVNGAREFRLLVFSKGPER